MRDTTLDEPYAPIDASKHRITQVKVNKLEKIEEKKSFCVSGN